MLYAHAAAGTLTLLTVATSEDWPAFLAASAASMEGPNRKFVSSSGLIALMGNCSPDG